MLDFLINLVSPIFVSMGASAQDVSTYAHQVSGYIYAILALLVVAIVVVIASQFVVKKGFRHVVSISAVLAWVLITVVIANMICFGPLYNTVSTVLNAEPITLSDETIANSKAVIQETGEEGLVLVKNNGLLPLSEDTTALNVFGWDSTNPLFGGTGSGSSDGSSAIGIIQSLQDAGYSTNEELTQMYVDYRADRPSIAMASQDWTLPEPTIDYYTSDLMSNAESFSDTAVIVIGRSGGEGADLPTDMYGVIHGTWDIRNEVSANPDNYGYTAGTYTNNGDYDDFDEGETYLELSNTEEAMIDLVCSSFDNVIVVINANNTMELGWVDEYDSIGAVILAPGTGNSGMEALGEIINGSVNPSGKTVDTFVKDLTATPTWNNFGNNSYTNVDDMKEALVAADSAFEGNIDFVNYVEGIYVGYKFYETAAEEGLINYEETVQYPFGYGLSYTTFTQEIQNLTVGEDSVTLDVVVTNTGSVAGKDVVELYYTPPYTNGGIEKASVNLVDYGKTSLLEAGASETISFEIPLEDMASYDSSCIKTANGGYILEAGEYAISVRSDSHTVLAEETFTLDADIDYSTTGRESDDAVANNLFDDVAGDVEYLSRADGFANYEAATAAPSEEAYVMSDETRAALEPHTNLNMDYASLDDASDEMPTLGADNGLTLADLTGADYDDERWDQLLDQLTVDEMVTMINMGGWQTAAAESVGKVATNDCDGPAGLNNFLTGAQGTAFPSEVLMAQTWSKEMAAKLGDAMANEYADANNYGWYGPAMNTHRSAFAGRNFEYYSEDGVLAGKFASAQVNAAAAKGVYAYIKHFALNDQETNRCSLLLTWSNEQAMREIYLKPFEEVVKNYDQVGCLAVMSSFNFIGTTPTDQSSALLNTVLRDEWGFRGMVETDYNGSYGYMNSSKCVRNGNDLMLGFGMAESNAFTDTDAATEVLAMRQACKNILYTIGNSGYYTNADDSASGMTPMTKMFVTIDVIAAVVCLGLEALVIALYLKKKKKA